jgi:hypothetical protein
MCVIALYYQVMDYLDLKDSPRKIVAIYAINYSFTLYLMLHTCIQIFDKIWFKFLEEQLNKASF